MHISIYMKTYMCMNLYVKSIIIVLTFAIFLAAKGARACSEHQSVYVHLYNFFLFVYVDIFVCIYIYAYTYKHECLEAVAGVRQKGAEYVYMYMYKNFVHEFFFFDYVDTRVCIYICV